MTRLPSLCVLLSALLAGAGAWAQPAPLSAPPSVPALTPAEAQQALQVLSDPVARDRTIAVLRSLARAAPERPLSETPAVAPVKPAVPAATAEALVEPNSLGAQLVLGASRRLGVLTDDLGRAARVATDLPLLASAFSRIAADPANQALLRDTAWQLLLTMAAALLGEAAMRRLLRRPMTALAAHARVTRPEHVSSTVAGPSPAAQAEMATDTANLAAAEAGEVEISETRVSVLARTLRAIRLLPFVLIRLVLELLPVLTMLGVGYAALVACLAIGAQASAGVARLATIGALEATAACLVATGLTRTLIGPGQPHLLPVGETLAVYLLRWVWRIAAIIAFGWALAEIALLFGLYALAHDALLKLVSLAVHGCLIVVVLQTRAGVAGWIAGHTRPEGGSRRVLLRLRLVVAQVWHIVAIVYLVAMWVIWALDVPGGFIDLLRLTLVTALMLGAARLVWHLAVAWLDRATRVPHEMQARYPGLEPRLASYYPLVRLGIKCAVGAMTVVALAESWGFDAFGWFTAGALGGRLVSSLLTVAVTVVAGAAAWEFSNAALQRHLVQLTAAQDYARSVRLRTLLPMLRTTLLAVILLLAGLTVLSEIGVNIAPLLAGAGVLGIAVGFGSQKLVQDVITGLFLLLENIMQVGDVVTLAGLSGTVENLSVRTIRLRALDGSVHIIPFSAVTSVTNLTRDFGFSVLDVPVGLNEEPDHIAGVLRDVAREMRGEERWQTAMQDELEVLGVERFLDQAWLMRVRVKTVAAQRWVVGRELNRRIKYRFDKDAIESPLTSYRALHQARPNFTPLPDPLAPPTPR